MFGEDVMEEIATEDYKKEFRREFGDKALESGERMGFYKKADWDDLAKDIREKNRLAATGAEEASTGLRRKGVSLSEELGLEYDGYNTNKGTRLLAWCLSAGADETAMLRFFQSHNPATILNICSNLVTAISQSDDLGGIDTTIAKKLQNYPASWFNETLKSMQIRKTYITPYSCHRTVLGLPGVVVERSDDKKNIYVSTAYSRKMINMEDKVKCYYSCVDIIESINANTANKEFIPTGDVTFEDLSYVSFLYATYDFSFKNGVLNIIGRPDANSASIYDKIDRAGFIQLGINASKLIQGLRNCKIPTHMEDTHELEAVWIFVKENIKDVSFTGLYNEGVSIMKTLIPKVGAFRDTGFGTKISEMIKEDAITGGNSTIEVLRKNLISTKNITDTRTSKYTADMVAMVDGCFLGKSTWTDVKKLFYIEAASTLFKVPIEDMSIYFNGGSVGPVSQLLAATHPGVEVFIPSKQQTYEGVKNWEVKLHAELIESQKQKEGEKLLLIMVEDYGSFNPTELPFAPRPDDRKFFTAFTNSIRALRVARANGRKTVVILKHSMCDNMLFASLFDTIKRAEVGARIFDDPMRNSDAYYWVLSTEKEFGSPAALRSQYIDFLKNLDLAMRGIQVGVLTGTGGIVRPKWHLHFKTSDLLKKLLGDVISFRARNKELRKGSAPSKNVIAAFGGGYETRGPIDAFSDEILEIHDPLVVREEMPVPPRSVPEARGLGAGTVTLRDPSMPPPEKHSRDTPSNSEGEGKPEHKKKKGDAGYSAFLDEMDESTL